MNVSEQLGHRPKTTLIALGCLVLLLVGVVDYFAARHLLDFSVFFVSPVAFFSWFIHRRAGFVAAVVTAVIALLVNLASPLHRLYPGVAYWNALVWLVFFLLVPLIVGELKLLYARERQLSRRDDLTHIANRLAFYETAKAEKDRAKRYGQPITLVYADLDGFKEVNDSFGHNVGDKLLVGVARTMQKNIRRTDTVARMGGDEFAIILPNTNKQAAAQVLRKLMQRLSLNMQQHHWPVTVSMGAVTFTTPPDSLQEMIKLADEVMYSVKTSGKNRLEHQEIAADERAA